MSKRPLDGIQKPLNKALLTPIKSWGSIEHGLGVIGMWLALKWYVSCGTSGFAHAQANLGTIYALGRGVTKDTDEAIRWYILAANQGDAQAQFNLGSIYGSGAEKKEIIKSF